MVVEFVEVDAVVAAVFVFAAVGLPVGKADLFFIIWGSVCKFSLAIFPMCLSIFDLTVYTTKSMYFFILFFKISHTSLSVGSWLKL